MNFHPLDLTGAFLIELNPKEDDRGFFARVFCSKEFGKIGLASQFVQCNISYNRHKGTLRGLHYQAAPFGEVKLITCVRGSIYDVLVDLRRDSPTYKRWVGVTLSADNRRLLYAPIGCAHGYMTLEDEATVFYMVSEFYHPEAEQGVRWNDPAFAIRWPMTPVSVSAKDRNFPDWSEAK